MKTSVETVSGVEKRIRVEIPADEVSRRVEQGYAEVRKMAPLRGFRKGKAPMSMVRRVFKESVEADVAERLVRDSLAGAVKENDLKVLSLPKIDGGTFTEGQEFVFTATVEVVPEVTPEGYKGIPVVRQKGEVTGEEVDAALGRLRESFAQYHAVEGRGAAGSDLVEFGFAATSEGQTVEKSDAASVVLEGGVPFGKEFESHLAGVRGGDEKRFEVQFETDFPNRKYAGKRVSFEVNVNAVRERKLPELDDEFAKGFGDVTGVSDLREKMRARLLQEAEEAARRNAEEQIRQGLLERNPFEVPKTLVDRQIVSMIEDTANRLVSQGVDLKKVSMDFEKMKERFAPNADRSVRLSLLLSAIGEKEGIDVPFSEIEAEMKTMAAGAGIEYEKIRELYGDENRMDNLRNMLLDRKVMAFLLENAEAKEEVAE
ncbi:MAG: trigger factor [Deltaproteobacteria bacterium]|jgi:trigger factor|nr:MAG: trigger factor [Deltaproteobacteria bacterium]